MNNSGGFAPEDAGSWLQSHGWRRESQAARFASLWRRDDHEVLLPLLPEATDFARRAGELLSELSRLERRAPETLIWEMLNEGSDVCEWRAAHPHLIDNSIPLADGEQLVASAKMALIAAASATLQRRAYFGHGVTKRAREHARTVRMGQTRPGSYIVPIISRIPTMSVSPAEQPTLDMQLPSDPYERQVMHTLAEALTMVNTIAVQAELEPSNQTINESVSAGVSFELCAAIAATLRTESVSELEVSFSWARRLPTSKAPKLPLTFPKEAVNRIGDVAAALQGSAMVGEQTLVGFVRSLRRAENDVDGTVLLHTTLGNERRYVQVTLSPKDYEEAGLAHQQKRPVFVRGVLNREAGRRWHFERTTGFGIAAFIPEPTA
jgi:hypothetical protein